MAALEDKGLRRRVERLERENRYLREALTRQAAALDRAREVVKSAAVSVCAEFVRAEELREGFRPLVEQALEEGARPDPYQSTSGRRRTRTHCKEGPDFVFGSPSERAKMESLPEDGENA